MRFKAILFTVIILTINSFEISAQKYGESDRIRVAIVKNPFGASESIIEEGLIQRLEAVNCNVEKNETFDLNAEENTYKKIDIKSWLKQIKFNWKEIKQAVKGIGIKK